MRKMAAVALAMALGLGAHAAGAESGAPPDAGLRVGVSTFDDLVKALGRPMTVINSSDGSRIAVYASVHARPKAASFIPIVGLFAGGATASSSSATYTFGPDGLLTGSSSQSTNIDCSMNVTAIGCGKPKP